MYRSALVTLALAASLDAAAITVVNHSFEDPVLAPGTSVANPVGTGWIWDPTIGGFPGAGGWSIAHPLDDLAGPVLDGDNVAILQPNGALYQLFDPAEFVAGTPYRVTVDIALLQDGCCEDAEIRFGTSGPYGTGSVRLIQFGLEPPPIDITRLMFDFVLGSDFDPDTDSPGLYFINYSAASRSLLIDNVTVTAIPLPGGVWLFVPAVALLTRLCRRHDPKRSS